MRIVTFLGIWIPSRQIPKNLDAGGKVDSLYQMPSKENLLICEAN
jgi:hypothetical protein